MSEKNVIYSEELINALSQMTRKGSADPEYLRYLNWKREQEREKQEEKDRGLFSRLFNKKKLNPFIKKIGGIAIFIGKAVLKGILFAMGIDLFKTFFDINDPMGSIDIIYF